MGDEGSQKDPLSLAQRHPQPLLKWWLPRPVTLAVTRLSVFVTLGEKAFLILKMLSLGVMIKVCRVWGPARSTE